MRDSWLRVAGLEIHVVEWTPDDRAGGDEGAPVLLVHGLGASTISWEPVGSRLADALATTVTAVDLPGFGRSRLPPGRRATVAASGRAVRAVLEQRGPAVVMGNSMGGALAVGLAARHPALVRALVLVDAALPWAGRGLVPWQVMARFAPLVLPQLGGRFAGYRARRLGPERVVDTTLEWTLARPERLDPALRRRIVDLAMERQAFGEAPSAYADAARSLFVYLQAGMRADLARLTCPTMLVHGELDRLVPVSSAAAAAARRPDFELAVIEDCGHAPQLECPDRFLDVVVPWLSRVRAEAPRG